MEQKRTMTGGLRNTGVRRPQGISRVQLTFNIGLENNPLNTDQILELFGALVNESRTSKFSVVGHRLDMSEYEGNPGRTLIVRVSTSVGSLSLLNGFVKALCSWMTQDSIAYKQDGSETGVLVYNVNHVGDKQEFNGEYFIEL